jgi:endonuclease YncB( thermonuclease family)
LWRNQNDIHCVVSQEKKIFNQNLNLILVKKGLANIAPYEQRFNGIAVYKNLYKNLISCEKKAQKERVGIWYKPSKWDLFKLKAQNYLLFFNKITKVFKFNN